MRPLISFFLFLLAFEAYSKEHLVIISPHRKSIQSEFIPKFKDYYQKNFGSEISIDWLDQGGASDDFKFILSRFEKNAASSKIDIFWGGGEQPHYELEERNLLSPHKIPQKLKEEVPQMVGGSLQYNEAENWHAAALSTFGIFFNRLLLKMQRIPEPEQWTDLASPKFFNSLSNSDLRRSSVSLTLSYVILQAEGWEQGWSTLTRMAGNTRSFRHSSSDPIKDVVSADAAAGITVGYFANSKVNDLGKDKLGFTLPEQTIVNADPISILKGAPNKLAAERFVEFVLSSDAQKMLILPKEDKEGPKFSDLGRLSVNKKAYEETEGRRLNELDPFNLKIKTMKFDANKAFRTQLVLADLIGTIHIDQHELLKQAWQSIIKRGLKEDDLKTFSSIPVSEQELESFAQKWKNNVFRNTTINHWSKYAVEKYTKLIEGK